MALARLNLQTIRINTTHVMAACRRAFSIEIDSFKDKETAEEAVFMSKQDEKLLRDLLKKVKQQADAKDKHHAVGESAADLSALKEILGKYNIADADLQAVVKWKHSS